MAPLTRPAGSEVSDADLSYTNGAPQTTSNQPEIIEIDDEDGGGGGGGDAGDESVEDYSVEEDDEDGEEETVEEEEDDDDEDEVTEDSDEPSMNGHSGRSNGARYASEGSVDANDQDSATPELLTSAGAQEALHPLRRTADRVTHQIEAFAEKLNRFKQRGKRTDDNGSVEAAYHLVQSYRSLALNAIQDISRQQTVNRAKKGWNASRSASVQASDAPSDDKLQEEMKRLQLEADTWRLLLNLISIDGPTTRAHAKETQATCFQKLHKYSSDREIWEQFLDADHYATGCVLAMKWLEQTAKESSQDIDKTISELETQAERGQGLWAHGWLYTKETIKGQKRLRAWPQPVEPKDSKTALALLTSEKKEPLITQLDPDAITRQKLGLQKQDQFHEQATWMICWKMLRQGENWTTIREWAHERLEYWRAVSLCGTNIDANSGTGRTPVDDPSTRMMNFDAQESWQAACSALAQDPNAEEPERAVYALLCGETQPAYKVCRSWDDYLYVYLNSMLLSRYQNFCRQFRRKLTFSPTSTVAFTPMPAGYADMHSFLQHAKNSPQVGVEARNPYRTIQGVILSKSYDEFFYSLAKAVSKAFNVTPEQCSYLPELSLGEVDGSMFIAAQDKDALRIATHLYVVANSLGYVRSDTQFVETASLSIAGYISNLEDAGLFNIIPLYASFLPTHGALFVLGQILIEVVSPKEKNRQVKLIQKQGIDIEAVLETRWRWVTENVSGVERPRTIKGYPKVQIRKDGIPELAPVRKDFIGPYVIEDEQTVRSFEWLRYIDGQWPKICLLGRLLYRKFFVSGNLAAARELSRRMRLEDISMDAFGFDVSEYPLTAESVAESAKVRGSAAEHGQSLSSALSHHDSQSIMCQQSQTMRNLEQLILGLDAVEAFAAALEEYGMSKTKRDTNTAKEFRQNLQDILEELMGHMSGVLQRGWLPRSHDETEEAELEYIRVTYVPELILQYHNVLYFSARTLTSEYLVDCMNLSTQVADNQELTRVFVAARRMTELVDALALSSKAIVNTRSAGKKKFANGETLEIWDVKVEDDEANELFEEASRG